MWTEFAFVVWWELLQLSVTTRDESIVTDRSYNGHWLTVSSLVRLTYMQPRRRPVSLFSDWYLVCSIAFLSDVSGESKYLNHAYICRPPSRDSGRPCASNVLPSHTHRPPNPIHNPLWAMSKGWRETCVRFRNDYLKCSGFYLNKY